MRKPSHLIAALLATMTGAMFAGPVLAQGSFPTKPVTLILPLAAGGPVDTEIRIYLPRISEILGQTVLVDYKLGAAGIIAGSHVAKSAPDGYTLLVVNGAFATFPALYKDLPFDVLKDFAPVSLASKRGQLLLV
jgi:tripartite-type tricarboxylate transporter receptor subunit TctC